MSLRKGAVALATALLCSLACAEEIQTRVAWMERCPSEGPPTETPGRILPIAAALVPYAINAGVDYASAALTKAVSDKTDTSSATINGHLYEIDAAGVLYPSQQLQCLVVIRGVFDGSQSAPEFSKWAVGDLAGLQIPHFRFEAKLDNSDYDKNVYRLKPIYVESTRAESRSIFASSRRDYNVSVTLVEFSSATSFASATFNMTVDSPGPNGKLDATALGRIISGPISLPSSLAAITAERRQREKTAARAIMAATIIDADWQSQRPAPKPRPDEYARPEVRQALHTYCANIRNKNKTLSAEHKYYDERCLHDITAESAQVDAAVDKALISPESVAWAKQVCASYHGPNDNRLSGCGLTEKRTPVGLFLTNATLTETRHGAEWAKVFAKAVDDSRETLKSSAKSLLPSEQDKARQAAQVTARQNSQSVMLADLAVQAAQDSLDELLSADAEHSKVSAARIELLKAKISRNDAYRKAGLPLPDPEIG
ncbi:hypothetical protein WS50_09030 [Burkholderia territorii]|uniref:hypothetical protein n=1 Tax=Burkholderia territorii TaxID=1503055 RepID=UPI00075A867F|nr:hypothetical protein [Burkholderia territorii]KUZ01953.1 hypothetical protein WS47_03880 [Burkholderia territorii]KUZ21110.1 hypothetical protein WS50_09030 [Burkholderia territorii]